MKGFTLKSSFQKPVTVILNLINNLIAKQKGHEKNPSQSSEVMRFRVGARNDRRKDNKKAAFTLAEVLITLGIIGVVAAITLPSLIANCQKKVLINQLKQTSSMFTQGFKLYMAEEGISDLSGDLDWTTDTKAFNNLVKKYFKVARDCDGAYYPCSATIYHSLTGNKKVDFSDVGEGGASCQVTIVLLNGAFVCFDALGYVDETDNSVLNIEFDVNGSAGPNKFGVDYYSVRMDIYGNIFDANYKKNGFMYDSKWPENGAYGKIVADGWKMNYSIK